MKMSSMIFASFTVLSMLLAGCSKDNPMTPPDQAVSASPEASGQQVQMLKLPTSPALGKVYSVSSPISVAKGGKLELECKGRNDRDEEYSVHLELKFEPGSVSDDFLATLTMDNYYLMSSVDMEFGPHRTVFLKPAKLTVKVTGVDLTGFTKDDPPKLYYDDNGTWVPMEGDVKIDPNHFKLECKNGELPHFSRYCFGR